MFRQLFVSSIIVQSLLGAASAKGVQSRLLRGSPIPEPEAHIPDDLMNAAAHHDKEAIVEGQHDRALTSSLSLVNNCGMDITHFAGYVYDSSWENVGNTGGLAIPDGTTKSVPMGAGGDALYFYAHNVACGSSCVVTEVATTSVTPGWTMTWNFGSTQESFPMYKYSLAGGYTVDLCPGSGGGGSTPTNPAPTASPTPSPTAVPVTSDESAALATCNGDTTCMEWIQAHNTRRKAYHESHNLAASLLIWDPTLAAEAQAWADTFDNGDNSCSMAHDPNRNGGENLANNAAAPVSAAASRTPEEVLQAWWDDEYDQTQEPTFSESDFNGVKHFTQAAFYDTKKLGCGSIEKDVTFQSSSGPVAGKCFIQVCRYLDSQCNLSFGTWESDVLTNKGC